MNLKVIYSIFFLYFFLNILWLRLNMVHDLVLFTITTTITATITISTTIIPLFFLPNIQLYTLPFPSFLPSFLPSFHFTLPSYNFSFPFFPFFSSSSLQISSLPFPSTNTNTQTSPYSIIFITTTTTTTTSEPPSVSTSFKSIAVWEARSFIEHVSATSEVVVGKCWTMTGRESSLRMSLGFIIWKVRFTQVATGR